MIPDLSHLGVKTPGRLHLNLRSAQLLEQAICRREGVLTARGALAVETGQYTGRSPNDKFIVDSPGVHKEVWWGPVNQPIKRESFERLHARVIERLEGRELFVFDGFAGCDPEYRLPIRVINEFAWQNLFVRALFVRPSRDELEQHEPGFTVICLPSFKADPERDGTRSEVFVVIDFERRLVIIGGTQYAGEIKKSIFTVMNYLMPERDVFPMHCSANVGREGDVALFFGLSGTGKTTLSADPERELIGDDEHGWSSEGVFNFEGGCYAKCIHLSKQNEPQIWEAIRFGAVLENVVVDPDYRSVYFDDASRTENTRAAYPVEFIPGAIASGMAGHPRVAVFLTADAFGVLPPISRLTREQAMYHFLSGYTSKLAGTERGVVEPEATFSACFGAPFLPRPPAAYASLLGQRIDQHRVRVYLVNTGWSGGVYGEGQRIALAHTRAMISAILNGRIEKQKFVPDRAFKVSVPLECPGVPSEILAPRNRWKDKEAYDRRAGALVELFQKNFEKFSDVPTGVSNAGPR